MIRGRASRNVAIRSVGATQRELISSNETLVLCVAQIACPLLVPPPPPLSPSSHRLTSQRWAPESDDITGDAALSQIGGRVGDQWRLVSCLHCVRANKHYAQTRVCQACAL
jgi:hypothetical protein